MQVTQFILKRLVDFGEVTADDFEAKTSSIDDDLAEGELMLQLVYISVDPYLRSRMKSGKGYFRSAFVPGSPAESGCVAKVVPSKRAGYSAGDFVVSILPWQTYVVVPATTPLPPKVDTSAGVPLSYFLGTIGAPGFSAYGSLERIGSPQMGETVFVSGAAGAVGQVVGQLCKNVYGCKVIGSAGSHEKVAFLKDELGYDAAFNYKTTDTDAALKEYAPDGIDIYFDNVGGPTLETALYHCRPHARVICCGSISQYNKKPEEQYGVKSLFCIVTKSIRMEGFLVSDWYETETKENFYKNMPKWVAEGKVKVVENVVQGIENTGAAFVGMMDGKNLGKQMVQVAEDPFRT